jgi:hypothetical protein
MDALKIVPQVFFDLIARVVPGLTAIVLLLSIVDCTRAALTIFLFKILTGTPFDNEYPSGLVAISALITAYIVGHLISPFTKLVEDLGRKIPKKIEKASSENYNWLRLHEAEAGALCAKVRAEFMMYDGLAVVFFASAVAVVIKDQTCRHVLWAVALAFVALLMGYRGRRTYETYGEVVNHLYNAAH